ncbi:hypothetical protein H9636_15970 [Ureibacillus sp. Re31]|uniref:Prophage pi2 protein 40 n=1 Tax=Ureibacillus galli TaxID=2762222 RepID=A0ABR8XFY5_9BACL|nr:hypothetical protein [Ureibacillus galli]MBD8028145.1 hypothetical protein [Ureibacillus galli]
MEKTIEIDGKQVTFKSSGAVPKRYKMQFQRDFFNDLLSMGVINVDFEKMSEQEKLEIVRKVNFDMFYDIAWTLAKTANPEIKDPLTWLDSFDSFPIVDILPQINDLLYASISTKKK